MTHAPPRASAAARGSCTSEALGLRYRVHAHPRRGSVLNAKKEVIAMRTEIVNVIAGLVGAALMAPPAFAADSCGGGCPKLPSNARSVSGEVVPLATFGGNTLTATLAKGKTKRILHVEGMLTDGGAAVVASRAYALAISVNGLQMHPSGLGPAEAVEDCGAVRADPDASCTVTGHWWLDMDDPADAALLGVPITVTLAGGDLVGGPAVGKPVDMSLQVRLDKK